jgi:hypothetical protein
MSPRLPGLAFELVAPPTVPGLPPMDMALFAGFAARGPCHRALTLDSAKAFADTFGAELSLARDSESGIALVAQLAAAVAGFFANGGQRCQVIRLARTAEVATRWGAFLPDPDCAEAALFAISGALARLPGPDGLAVAPAQLAAASLGSWADTMTLAARTERLPLTISAPLALAHGFSFLDRDSVAVGDLIDITDADGGLRRFARVVRRDGGTVLAVWAGAFALANKGPEQPVTVAGVAAQFTPGSIAELRAMSPLTVPPGGWLSFAIGTDTLWMRVDRQDRLTLSGPTWREVKPELPEGPFTAQRLQLGILVRLGGDSSVSNGMGSGILEPLSLATLADDDSFYTDPAHAAARARPAFAAPASVRAAINDAIAAAGGLAAISARFGTTDGSAAEAALLAAGWLPLGLGNGFGPGDPALAPTRPALARDGLSRHDEQLYVDPELAGLSTDAVIPRAHALRDLEGLALLGIHAALNDDEDPYQAASIITLPDAAQPGWERRLAKGAIAPAQPGSTVPPRWRDHLGGCGGDGDSPLLAPDARRFLDCETQLVTTPVLTAPAFVSGCSFTLSWEAGVANTEFVLEESPRADFAAAAEIWRGTDSSFVVAGRPGGIFYYRLRAERAGNISAYAAAGVTVQRSAYEVTGPDADRLALVHVALLRLAAGSANCFALLSLPQGWRADEAARYAKGLATTAPGYGGAGRLGDAETRALSYGALHHPWLVSGSGLATCPDGAMAGSMASRSRRDGSWAAPANLPLVDVIGLEPALSLADFSRLEDASVNSIRATPRGFMALAAMTLSGEPEWRQIGTRRLMILLRRALMRSGAVHVFEPDNDVTRRAVTRSLTMLLDQLQRRGAFAGASSAESFRVAEAVAEYEDSRLIVDIAVAPAAPLRFLNIRLARRGATLAISEAA